MPWYVLITKPKAEKKVTARLQNIGIKVCCPTRIEHKQWSDRIKKVETPLLPSMVLVNIEDKQRDQAFSVPGVVRYLFWMGKPAQVTQQEVDVLNDLHQNPTNILEVVALKEGSEIEVTNLGSHTKKGVIKKISGNTCWVTLQNLGYIVKVKV